jgi:hypothetical protein
MAILRSVLLMLMIVAFLPWGAFSAKFVLSVESALDDSQTLVAPGKYETDKSVVAVKAKRCKGPSLPGSPCGPSVIATQSVDVPDYNRLPTQARFIRHIDLLEGVSSAAFLDPPILV